MIFYLILAMTAFTVTVQNIFKQKFNERCAKRSAYFFSMMTSFVAMLFFVLINVFYNKDWYYSAELLVPSAGFAVSYAAATVFSVLAILYGPLAKTSLIISCSLLVPSIYGIFVQGIYIKVIRDGTATLSEAMKEALSPTLILGTILLVITLFLVNSQKKSENEEEKKASLKWLIYVTLAFLGNGLCSTVQTAKKDFYGAEGNNMFMIVALAMVVVLLISAAFSFKTQRVAIKETAEKGWWLALLCGGANGLTNFFVMLLTANDFPASVLFPVVSGGGLLMVFLWSVLIKKEKFTVPQYIGYALGVVSIVLLNI